MLFRIVLRPVLLIGLSQPPADLLDRGLESDEGAHLGLEPGGVPLGPLGAGVASRGPRGVPSPSGRGGASIVSLDPGLP